MQSLEFIGLLALPWLDEFLAVWSDDRVISLLLPNASKEKRVAFAALFTNFLSFGAVTTIVGATLPMVIRSLHWNDLEAGVVIAANAIGYFSATFVAGLLVHRFGFRMLISTGLLFQTIGVGCFGLSASVPFNVGAFLLLGLGQGATELVTNYSVVQMETPGRSRLMNLMHSAFTVGAIGAPFLTGFLTAHAVSWRAIYLLLAAVSLIMVVVFLGNCLRSLDPRQDGSTAGAPLLRLLRHPLLLLLTVTIFLYVGVELGVSNWVAEYFVRVFNTHSSRAAYMVSGFWLGILLGRVAMSTLYHGNRQSLVLLLFCALAALSLMGALLIQAVIVSALLFFFTGLGCSIVYPTVMTIVGQTWKEQRGPAIGVVSAGGGVGMCLLPLVMSGIANSYGIESGFWFYLAGAAAMTIVAGSVYWMTNSRNEAILASRA